MLKIEWSLPAIGDLKSAGEYIAEDNPDAATRMAARILESVEYLIDQPPIGRPGRLAETRELVVSGPLYYCLLAEARDYPGIKGFAPCAKMALKKMLPLNELFY